MKKPLHQPFRALRGLKRELAKSPEQASGDAEEVEPTSFAETAETRGVKRGAVAPGRVEPPAPERYRVAEREAVRRYAFSVRLDAGRVEARRDDVEPVVLSWLLRQDPEATLDLHGATAEHARRRVHRFVRGRAKRGDKVVCIITGRGVRISSDAVLRKHAPEWLAEERMHGFIRAFVTAPPHWGGEGALIVLLA